MKEKSLFPEIKKKRIQPFSLKTPPNWKPVPVSCSSQRWDTFPLPLMVFFIIYWRENKNIKAQQQNYSVWFPWLRKLVSLLTFNVLPDLAGCRRFLQHRQRGVWGHACRGKAVATETQILHQCRAKGAAPRTDTVMRKTPDTRTAEQTWIWRGKKRTRCHERQTRIFGFN